MATIQLRRKTTAGVGPLVGTNGKIKQGEPLIDLNGGNLYIAKKDKVASSSAPLVASDYLEFISRENLINFVNGSIGQLKLGTASKYNIGAGAGNVPIIHSDGKLDPTIMPQIALTNTFVASNEAGMLALKGAEIGDICIRNDLSQTFILKQSPATSISNWELLKTPSDQVTSVNGKKGAVTISLSELGGVSNSTHNSHVSSNLHLTEWQRESLSHMYLTDLKSASDQGSIWYLTDIRDIDNECIEGGLLIGYELDDTYAPGIKAVKLGINRDKVLTPSSVIDGGTY